MGLGLTSGTLIFFVSNYSLSPLSGCGPSALKDYMPRLAVTHYCGCAIVVSHI